jgi:uncharacterized SAM-binding protein YcdF (DUF218 family)
VIKQYVTPFLVPPGLFVAALLALALLSLRARRRGRSAAAGPGAGAFLLLALLLYALSVPPVSDRLMAPLEARAGDPSPPFRGDAIVVLGGGVYGGAADLSGTGAPTEEACARLLSAARLQRLTGLPVVASGGSSFPGKPPEAPVMKRFLEGLGVPPEVVTAEGTSRDTRENGERTAGILRAGGRSSPLLVTSAYHMPRSLLLLRHAGLSPSPVPCAFRTWPGKRRGPEDWLPSASALRDSAAALREYLGLLYYRLALR